MNALVRGQGVRTKGGQIVGENGQDVGQTSS